MPAPTTPLTGDALLVAVTDAMVGLHRHYHLRAKTTLLGGDLLACVLGGVYTDVEKTMIELERTTIVQETRSAFQNAMQHEIHCRRRTPVRPRSARVHLQPPRRPRHGDRTRPAQPRAQPGRRALAAST